MVRLKNLDFKNSDNCPDYIVDEVAACCKEITEAVNAISPKYHSNVLLSAVNQFHALVLKTIIIDDPKELKTALCTVMRALMNNLDRLAGYEVIKVDISQDKTV